MTVIAAVADGTTVWMAADTAEHVSGTLAGRARKIRRITLPHDAGTILLGAAGSGGIMAAAAERAIPDGPDTLIPDGDLDRWADDLAIHLTQACAATNPALTEPDRDGMTVPSGNWLLGYHGRLWHILTHHALPCLDGFAATGCGQDLALGWMLGAQSLSRANGGLDVYQRDLVTGAVRAACARIPYCSAPDGPLVETLGAP